MIDFKAVTLLDKEWIDQHVMCENVPSADYNFGNMFIWDEHYRQLVCSFGERTLTKVRLHGEPAFVFPIGCGPLRPAMEAIREYAAAKDYPLILRGVTEAHREQLEAEYPGRFTFCEEERWADYIYEAERLATYAGKALHGKKNHCNRFEAEHEWSFVPLTRENIPACLRMLDDWTEENAERLDKSIVYEHDAIERAFTHYEALGLEGGVLYADGKLMGFSFGEMASLDCFDVHVEKADISVNGAYPMVCREMVRMAMRLHPGLKYINREDDMGLESLRRSKQSYKPAFLLKKYTARWIDE
ncbi:MAG: DUF2156 domain-containing protein [Oscillospiraceae bacterium]|nr:DUF2156 domain-containing protein [Oscillospiraceae bacterium]